MAIRRTFACILFLGFGAEALKLGQPKRSQKVQNKRKLFYMKLPKTASASFINDMKDKMDLKIHEDYDTAEVSYCLSNRDGTREVFTMMRDPVEHLHSMWSHCDHQAKTSTISHMPASFMDWIGSWKNSGAANVTFRKQTCCYDPWNMQSRRLSCDDSSDLSLAKKHLSEVYFVGLTDYYRESACAFHHKRSGQLLDGCTCASRDAFKMHRDDHGVKKQPSTGYHSTDLDEIKELLKDDMELYAIARARALADIRIAEKSHNVEILCGEVKPWSLSKHINNSHPIRRGGVSSLLQLSGDAAQCAPYLMKSYGLGFGR